MIRIIKSVRASKSRSGFSKDNSLPSLWAYIKNKEFSTQAYSILLFEVVLGKHIPGIPNVLSLISISNLSYSATTKDLED